MMGVRSWTRARGCCFGILNPYGGLWTHHTFPTEAAARAYVTDFWRTSSQDVSKFSVVPVRVRVCPLPSERTAPGDRALGREDG
jgi:hypothetical protein